MEQINLDLIPGKVKPVCHTSQYDIGRIIRLNLYMDGLLYTLTGTETISIMLRKSNFVVIIEEVTNTSSSYVEIETTENTCDVSGDYECELRVEDNEINIGSANFKMVVEPDAFDGQLATDTASGRIANFYTSLEEDLVENKTTFSATQDLHGQSAPYPAGGGKNKFSIDFLTASGITITNGEASGTAYTFADKFGATKLIPQLTLGANTQYTLSFDAYTDGASTSGTGLYIAFKYDDESTSDARCPNNTLSYTRFSVSNDTSKNLVGIYISYSLKSSNIWYLRNIQLEEGSPATAYTPYENICPIVGVDKVNVTRAGKNLCNLFKDGKVPSIVDGSLVNAATGGRTDYIKALSNTYYTFSIGALIANIYMFFYDENKNYISYTGSNTTSISYKTPANCGFIMLRTSSNPVDVVTPQLELGSTATTYEPYNSTTALIDLGNTYYGGTLDVIARKITLTHQFYNTLGANISNVVKDSSSWRIYYSSAVYGTDNQYKDGLCDKLVFKTSYSGVNGNNNSIGFPSSAGTQILIRNDALTSAQDVKDFMAMLEVVYPLATPLIIDLTEENIYEVSGSTVQFETKISKPIKTVETNFVFFQASGTPTPTTPLPITGYNKLAVCRCGKNLVDLSSMVFGYVTGTGTFALL